MFLEQLIAEGFKSIGKRVVIDLINDVNVIMGPNGSGKSNVFECIQWVFGGISAKQLRASSMNDVLFDGGTSEKAADFAEVTCVFNNSDRELELDTDKVLITRRLVRDKNNEYFINNEPARMKDLTKLFLNKGLGKNNYAITGQNRITEFIMMKPEETRGVVEEAAGISGVIFKKNELVASIANYDRDLERINDVMNEIARGIKPLKKQIKNAETYNVIKTELDERKLFYYKNKLEQLNNLLEKNTNEYNSKIKDKSMYEEEKAKLEEFLDNYNNSTSAVSLELKKVEESKNYIESLLSDYNKDKIMSENTYNNLTDKRNSMVSNIRRLEESSNVEEKEKENLFSSMTLLSKEIDKIKNELKVIDDSILKSKDSIEDNKKNISIYNNKLTGYIVEIERNGKDIEVVLEKKESLEKSLKYKGAEIDLVDKEILELIESKKSNLQKIDTVNSKVDKLKINENQIRAIESAINLSKKNDNRKNRTNEVKSLLTKVDGFCDVLFNIVSYDEKYINAIDTLYGGILHNFVVEDVKSAEKCISILKKNKIPPVNFIILAKVKSSGKGADIDNVTKVIDILNYDGKYKKFVEGYFYNTFIAESSKIAESVWNETNQKFRISTLEGTLYAANTLRGGYVQKNTKKLNEDYKKLLVEKDEILSLDTEKFANIYELKGKASLFIKENETIDRQVNLLEDKLNVHTADDLKIKSNIEDISSNFAILKEKIKEITLSKENCENLLASNEDGLLNSTNRLSDLDKEREVLIIDINKKETLASEQEKKYYVYKNSSEERIVSLKGNVDIVSDQIDISKEQLNKNTEMCLKKEKELETIKKRWEELRYQIEVSREDKDSKSSKLNDIISSIASLENAIIKLEFEIQKTKEEIVSSEEEASDIPEDTAYVEYEEDMSSIYKSIDTLSKKIKSLGFINTDAISEFNELNSRYEVVAKNKEDLETSKQKIIDVLQKIQEDMLSRYMDCFETLRSDLGSVFTKLFNGGSAELVMENPDNPLESGVIIKATPPGKKNKAISLLSGGEKSLAAVSFIFALLKYNPSPVVIFDEIDAALDEINVSLIADYISLEKNIQYVIVSHRTPMIKIAKALYGASMNKGVTELISTKL